MVFREAPYPTNTPPTFYGIPNTPEAFYVKQAALTLQVGCCLDPGLKRKQLPNEDALCVLQKDIPSISSLPLFFLGIADGMGGHGNGREASHFALQSLVRYLEEGHLSSNGMLTTLASLLHAGFHSVNQHVYDRNQQLGTKMGTTLTVALVYGTTAYIAHVGDSRCYLYRASSGLIQITRDHSVVARLVASGVIKPHEMPSHPLHNQLYRSLGTHATVEVDMFRVPLLPNDVLLLCSDGLWGMVQDQQITAILSGSRLTAAHTASALLRAALGGGGEDNVSAIVAFVISLDS